MCLVHEVLGKYWQSKMTSDGVVVKDDEEDLILLNIQYSCNAAAWSVMLRLACFSVMVEFAETLHLLSSLLFLVLLQ